MSHLMEPIDIPAVGEETHNTHCVFCKEATIKGGTSYIGADNDSTTLGNKLAAAGKPRVTFTHPEHGNFSSEPHHLTPGNEALKGHGIEAWLATRASGSKVQADTGFDINSSFNGAWLPSIPTQFVGVTGWSYKKADHEEMAIAIMAQELLQFHKGGHTNKGPEPTMCYIKQVKKQLDKVLEHVKEWKDNHCPIESKSTSEKSRPPFYVNDVIYAHVSSRMYPEVSGPPARWRYFISTVAYLAHQQAKSKHKPEGEPPTKKQNTGGE